MPGNIFACGIRVWLLSGVDILQIGYLFITIQYNAMQFNAKQHITINTVIHYNTKQML